MPRKLHKIVATVVGVLAAAVPVVAIHHGINTYIERQAADEVRVVALRTIARAEWRIGEVITALETIGKTPLRSCSDFNPDVVRRMVITTTPIKEISVVDDKGAPHCLNRGVDEQFWPLSRDLGTADDRVSVTVVRPVGVSGRALRVRWKRSGDPLQLVAYIPSDMFLPDNSASPAVGEPEVRVMLDEGTLVAAPSRTRENGADNDTTIITQNQSTRYPLVATAMVSRAAVLAEHSDLHAIGAVGSGALALLMIALAILLPWRLRADPVTVMEQALEAGEFIPYYQPIVDIRTGKIIGAEVLMRWRKPDGTLISPVTFIPLAESSGLILNMTRALMIAVRDEFGQVIGQRPRLKLGFNLVAKHFENKAIVEQVSEIFAGSPIHMAQIVLEVTERQPLEDLETARTVIAALQALGCKVAIDDVGTGHGGLSYMLKLGVDFIKIDKMFVDAIGAERHSTTIIETMAELARNMRMGIMAEGVETTAQVNYLRERGIYFAQGYAFAPPLPGSSFRQLLEATYPLGSDGKVLPDVPAIGKLPVEPDVAAA